MTNAAEVFRLGVLALLAGVALPLLVQAFLFLREARRATRLLEARLDKTLADLGEVVAELKRVSVPAPSLVAQLAAAVPPVLAAVHAFRATAPREPGGDEPRPGT